MAVNSTRQDEQLGTMSKWKVGLRLLSYLKRYKWSVILVIVVMAISVGITLVNPLIIESAIDDYLSVKDMDGLMWLGLFALGLNIVFIIVVKILPLFLLLLTTYSLNSNHSDHTLRQTYVLKHL